MGARPRPDTLGIYYVVEARHTLQRFRVSVKKSSYGLFDDFGRTFYVDQAYP